LPVPVELFFELALVLARFTLRHVPVNSTRKNYLFSEPLGRRSTGSPNQQLGGGVLMGFSEPLPISRVPNLGWLQKQARPSFLSPSG
jgi:hypothetical protein